VRRGRFVLAALVLLVQACATTPPPASDPLTEQQYLQRLERLQAADRWTVRGRLAVNDGDDGGSGSLLWRSSPARTQLDFHGALGRGAWRLDAAPGAAVLTLADGEEFRAASVERLVLNRLGWHVPVAELSWWIRGLAAPGGRAQRTLGESGVLLTLRQAGWEIEFSRYRTFGAELMPGLVVARQGARQVKFAIRDWSLGQAGATDA
jgi:outer membrane lipoprotein LolB